MVFLETVSLLDGRNRGVLHCPAGHCVSDGNAVLRSSLYLDGGHYRKDSDLGRSGGRLSYSGLLAASDWRLNSTISGNYRSVSGENLSGSKGKTDLYSERNE